MSGKDFHLSPPPPKVELGFQVQRQEPMTTDTRSNLQESFLCSTAKLVVHTPLIAGNACWFVDPGLGILGGKVWR